MRKFATIILMLLFSHSYAQNISVRANKLKEKYENVYYRSPQKYNKKEQKFNLNRIVFSSNYKGSKSKNIYQIAFYGKVNNNDVQVVYYAKSIDELDYYRKLFRGDYKKVLLFEHDYKVSSKTYRDISIAVEY